MRLIGLTGGIGSGKTTVSGFLREWEVPVVDADEGARAVVEPGTAGLARVVAEFGPEFLNEDGLDRTRLAGLVFGDAAALARLNRIIHPLVREWTARRIAEAERAGHRILVQDIPLLFENHLENLFEATILVHVPPALQLERLVARGMAEADARARLAAQLPIDRKLELATYVIDNSGSRESTQAQLSRLWTEITAAMSSGP